MLSQAEIDALLSGNTESNDSQNDQDTQNERELTSEEIDALGEIGNISMGTSATTLHSLLEQKVSITTPTVEVVSWEELAEQYKTSYVATKVEYVKGLNGSNLMLLKERDTKIIADLMMGGDGSKTDEEISDLHISAISEAMNQMIGSAATSMSSVFNKRIDISPPKAYALKLESNSPDSAFESSGNVVKVSFKMVIGEIIDSEIMQLIPIEFAKEMVASLLKTDSKGDSLQKPSQEEQHQELQQQLPQQEEYKELQQQPSQGQQYQQPQQQLPQGQQYQQPQQQAYMHQSENNGFGNSGKIRESVNVQPASFENFDEDLISFERKNISIIMDVPLEVTVELGRTKKYIREILEFGPGSIIELDKLAGEPVDILVNGKAIAKGEVVVIDENFGVRITDIIHPSKRI
jgi:flagellar motor switch protein FliN/FliY